MRGRLTHASLNRMEGGVGSPEGGIDQDPWPGRTLAEQIQVESLIGVGAMGRVYLGHQRGVERAVAVKVLHPELMHNPAVLARFHREARIASRLNHPNVVQVLMSGEVTFQGAPDARPREEPDSAAYLVMEYLDGASLAATLQAQSAPMPLERALHIVLQVCDAVGEAHGQGIVHRDIKPENVMLVRRGSDPDFVKVLDFGVAKLDWLDGAQATQAGTVFGTARYISPEGACGEDVTPRSDVYSIATLLYQCLAGRTPFDGSNTVAVLVKQRAETPTDLRSLVPGLPEPLAAVIHQNLAKAPNERAATARELGAALLAAARQSRVDPDALADRPTLHGSRSVPPISAPSISAPPVPGADDAPRRPTTLVDPELAKIPAGGEQRQQRRPWTEIAPIPDLAAEHDAIEQNGTRPRNATFDVTPSPLEVTFDGAAPSARETRMGRGAKRSLWLGAFAVLGAILSLLAARQLRGTEPSLHAELERANSALAIGAWQTDDKRGFVDVTDAALLRFPESLELAQLRARGAARLAREARKTEDVDPARARELARLAVHLAPSDAEIERLTRSLLAHGSTAPKIEAQVPEDGTPRSAHVPEGSQATPEATTQMRNASHATNELPPAAQSPAAEGTEEQPEPASGEPSSPEPVDEAPPEDVGEEPQKPGGRWL